MDRKHEENLHGKEPVTKSSKPTAEIKALSHVKPKRGRKFANVRIMMKLTKELLLNGNVLRKKEAERMMVKDQPIDLVPKNIGEFKGVTHSSSFPSLA
ncbi:unnamed protein product [Arabis nemorensis]|uniref:Uncharacterized protein n=1 Tax=Arabis nemorensis TaxID=586526 RepID=A0A565BL21_9BRAS|nr:unnamed protein product [Arabis nemorensis]